VCGKFNRNKLIYGIVYVKIVYMNETTDKYLLLSMIAKVVWTRYPDAKDSIIVEATRHLHNLPIYKQLHEKE
jgi:hypothetical protein